jgi:acetyltransferase
MTIAAVGAKRAEDLKGHGLGWLLMQLIIEHARTEGIKTIEGQVLRENASMLAMCRELGFEITADPNDVGICIARLTALRQPRIHK